MGWSGATARELQRPTTCMIANNSDIVSETKLSTGPAKAAAVFAAGEIFLGIDVAKARHVVARFVPGEGVKPTEGMTTDTLLARVVKYPHPARGHRSRDSRRRPAHPERRRYPHHRGAGSRNLPLGAFRNRQTGESPTMRC